MNIEVNIVAVIVSALLGMIIGYVWYAPFGFGKIWAKHAKVDIRKPNYAAIILASLSMIALAYGLAVSATLATPIMGGSFLYGAVSAGLFMWIVFRLCECSREPNLTETPIRKQRSISVMNLLP